MDCAPKVSVVMSVFDKPNDVQATIESVLSQQGVEFELVIVCDGADADVVTVVESFDDPRINVLFQANQGLTVALINGCANAQHSYIARVDAGDRMLADRLRSQAEALTASPEAGLVTCGVEFHTVEGYSLYTVEHSAEPLSRALRTHDRASFQSPVHASVMFRKSAYQRVGGYRPEFYFAQDCDLWARLVQDHQLLALKEILQYCVFSSSGLSGLHSQKQRQLADLVVSANRLRSSGSSDEPILELARRIRPTREIETVADEFGGLYFIASILSKDRPHEALDYWQQALSIRPFHLKARIKQLSCWLKATFNRRQRPGD